VVEPVPVVVVVVVVVEGRLRARLFTVAPLVGRYRMTEFPESTTKMEKKLRMPWG
jgi:hypothetical protein